MTDTNPQGVAQRVIDELRWHTRISPDDRLARAKLEGMEQLYDAMSAEARRVLWDELLDDEGGLVQDTYLWAEYHKYVSIDDLDPPEPELQVWVDLNWFSKRFGLDLEGES